MTPAYVFDVWAPPHAPWSLWAKPVLFAHVERFSPELHDAQAFAPVDLPTIPPADGTTALVLDLPGRTGVACAIAAAQKGYRPVPLYNAVPAPAGFDPSAVPLGAAVICDLTPIVAGLSVATSTLDRLNLPHQAPPAFLLDADRRVGTRATQLPGDFDNRSVSLPTDFPSANLLLSRGVQRVILVQSLSLEPQPDLAHTLLRWQQASIQILALSLFAFASPPIPIVVKRPPRFRLLWQRLAATAGLRRNPLGGFGGTVPIPSSSGG
ncbi:MAG TPA: hypothetical protein VF669_22075 [Tepidisphaeraceae bacterium]|jgi:hypothetical protein